MSDVEKALATRLANIEKRTGKTLAQLSKIVRDSGLEKHGELVTMLKQTLGLGHGDANTLVHVVRNGARSPAGNEEGKGGDPLDVLYVGPKAALRPIHDRLLGELLRLGSFEEAPKKTYVSYRRKKQFAMIGPATNTRVEVGLNVKGLEGGERLQALPPGNMCNYKVRIADVGEVDAELVRWLKAAYASAG